MHFASNDMKPYLLQQTLHTSWMYFEEYTKDKVMSTPQLAPNSVAASFMRPSPVMQVSMEIVTCYQHGLVDIVPRNHIGMVPYLCLFDTSWQSPGQVALLSNSFGCHNDTWTVPLCHCCKLSCVGQFYPPRHHASLISGPNRCGLHDAVHLIPSFLSQTLDSASI